MYERVSQIPACKGFESTITNMTSAFWHGLYPGYYLAFGTLTLQVEFQKTLYKNVRPRLEQAYGKDSVVMTLYQSFQLLYSQMTITYIFVPFVVLSFEESFKMYVSTYFILHLVAVVGIVVVKRFLPLQHPKRPAETGSPEIQPTVMN